MASVELDAGLFFWIVTGRLSRNGNISPGLPTSRRFPSTGPALRSLQSAGFKLFIVSNQSGVGRGYFTLEDVARVNARVT